jgi:hypothetical protein
MKNLAVLLSCVVGAVICFAGHAQAQSGAEHAALQAPILPMEIKFRHADQYLIQVIEDDTRYSKIEAVLDSDRSEIILTDKTMNRRAFYSSSSNRIDALQAHGVDAYPASIRIDNALTADSHSVYRIRFQDTYGQSIDWQFVAERVVPHANPEVISQPNDQGVLFVYAPRHASPAAGTLVSIDGKEHAVPTAAAHEVYQGWYSEDLTIAQIVSGTEFLAIVASPSNLNEGAQWKLKEPGGQEREAVVRSVSEGKLVIQQQNQEGQDAGGLSYELEINNDGYILRSVSLTAHSNTLWLFFDPGLPLPTDREADRLNIAFNIAENELAAIATGKLTVHQSRGVERVKWEFDAPESVRSNSFESAVSVIPEGAASDGKNVVCATTSCSDITDDPQ